MLGWQSFCNMSNPHVAHLKLTYTMLYINYLLIKLGWGKQKCFRKNEYLNKTQAENGKYRECGEKQKRPSQNNSTLDHDRKIKLEKQCGIRQELICMCSGSPIINLCDHLPSLIAWLLKIVLSQISPSSRLHVALSYKMKLNCTL